MYHLVHGLAVIKDTDHFYLRKHRIVIRDTDVLSLICQVNSPGKAMQHFFSEAWRTEERSVEILYIQNGFMCRLLRFHSKVYTRGMCSQT